MAEQEKIILSGMRPTGRLHLGHLEGALKNYFKMQESGAQCYFMVADIHALSTEYKGPGNIVQNSMELLLDWLAVGLDPEKTTMFVQSEVREHSELYVILGMLTPLAWAERCPTYKEQQQELQDRDLSTLGFLGYPVLQAADILLYRATHVPVGQDQLPHLEITREIGRRFNHLYGETLPEPQSMLTESPKVPGTDGRKMSKSYGNSIHLSDTTEVVEKKIKQMYTDPQKIHVNTPGNPKGCVVLALFKMYASKDAVLIETECREGKRGCMVCKKALMPILDGILSPIREKRALYADDRERLKAILAQGAQRARQRAQETMQAVRKAMQWSSLTSGRS
ncbi:tryptophan--tRNA ligase [bacterium]|nr:tryptophan--tRNA ligase [bacterium]